MPINKTNPEIIICFLNCINQYKKNNPFIIKKKGKNKVKTDNRGKNFGAKNGKT